MEPIHVGRRSGHRKACPWCGHARVHRWGHAAGCQRYRCTACRRTFSTFTGTALYYLKRRDRWAGFCRAMDQALTVREAAGRLGLHKDTVFRWRHRYLNALREVEDAELAGYVTVAQTRFRYSTKGTRRGPGAANPRGPHSPLPVWVLLARDERGRGVGSVTGWRPLKSQQLAAALRPVVSEQAVLVGGRGSYSPLAYCANHLELGYRPATRGTKGPPAHVQLPLLLIHRLRRWLRPFRGVATRYLDNYLLWFRGLETAWCPDVWDTAVVAPPGDRPAGSGAGPSSAVTGC